MDGLAGDCVLHKYFSKLNCVLDRFDEDDDLIEMELINQVHQLLNLLAVVKLDVVLAKTVKCQFALAFDQHFGLVAHEHTAGLLDLTR